MRTCSTTRLCRMWPLPRLLPRCQRNHAGNSALSTYLDVAPPCNARICEAHCNIRSSGGLGRTELAQGLTPEGLIVVKIRLAARHNIERKAQDVRRNSFLKRA